MHIIILRTTTKKITQNNLNTTDKLKWYTKIYLFNIKERSTGETEGPKPQEINTVKCHI